MDSALQNPVVLALAACVLLAIGVAVWMYLQKKKTQDLKSRFGPEYDKAIGDHHDRGHAETDLQKRAARVDRFHIHALDGAERSAFTEDWHREQSCLSTILAPPWVMPTSSSKT